jgi:hypothetical protein
MPNKTKPPKKQSDNGTPNCSTPTGASRNWKFPCGRETCCVLYVYAYFLTICKRLKTVVFTTTKKVKSSKKPRDSAVWHPEVYRMHQLIALQLILKASEVMRQERGLQLL